MMMARNGRRAVALGLAGLALGVAPPVCAQRRSYRFDETGGVLEFSVRHFGLLRSTGVFGDFDATVALDPADPGGASVAVAVRTADVALAYPGAVEMLRSPAFFDCERHPEARFTGAALGVVRPERFRIAGTLSLRGIEGPLVLEARLLRREPDPATGLVVAEFAAGGMINRSEFGMTEERFTISEQVGLAVRVRLAVDAA